MLETIKFKDKEYLKFQSEGNASQFAIPFAKLLCKGYGYDIGFGKRDWMLPDAIGIDRHLDNKYDAMNLPDVNVDYIYSSHCLEHLSDWIAAIEYWGTKIRSGGVLFLYLPHPDQEYWSPWNNRKHLHVLYPEDVKNCMENFGFRKIHLSGRDLNHSYIVVGEKI